MMANSVDPGETAIWSALFAKISVLVCRAEKVNSLLFLSYKLNKSLLLPNMPTDLDLHCLPLSMWSYINNLDQVIWLA